MRSCVIRFISFGRKVKLPHGRMVEKAKRGGYLGPTFRLQTLNLKKDRGIANADGEMCFGGWYRLFNVMGACSNPLSGTLEWIFRYIFW